MSKEIKINPVAMFDYIHELEIIISRIDALHEQVNGIFLMDLRDAYGGRATEDLLLFYSSLSAHLARLIIFYGLAQKHVIRTVEEMENLDIYLATWINMRFGK